MDSLILEKVLRSELRKAGERWRAYYKEMGDNKRLRALGMLAARRLIAEEVERQCGGESCVQEPRVTIDPELEGTRGPLGHDVGGGRRNIRSTKSFS